MKEFFSKVSGFFAFALVIIMIGLAPLYGATVLQVISHGVMGTDPINLFSMTAHGFLLACLLKYLAEE